MEIKGVKMNHEGSDTVNVEDENNDLSSIGGWLRFFQVINYINFTLSIVTVIALVIIYALLGDVFELELDGPALFLELIPFLIFSYLIIKALPVRAIDTPARIKSLIGYDLVVSITVSIILIVSHNHGLISDKPAPILISVIYYFIWATYFKKSKRVLDFYGSNAESK